MMKPIAAISLPLLLRSGMVSLFAQAANKPRKGAQDNGKQAGNQQDSSPGSPGKLFAKPLRAS
jgi:hypothetical protein